MARHFFRVGLLLGCILSQPTCLLQPNAGYVSMAPTRPGKLDLQANIGGGYPYLAWGSLHFDPFVTKTVSIPVDLLVTYPGIGTVRVGGRWRLAHFTSLGGGLGFFAGTGSFVDGIVDIEWALGHRWRWFGLSFTTRPTYIIRFPMITVPSELALAFFVKKTFAITVLINGGVQIYWEDQAETKGGIGGGLGIFWRL